MLDLASKRGFRFFTKLTRHVPGVEMSAIKTFQIRALKPTIIPTPHFCYGQLDIAPQRYHDSDESKTDSKAHMYLTRPRYWMVEIRFHSKWRRCTRKSGIIRWIHILCIDQGQWFDNFNHFRLSQRGWIKTTVSREIWGMEAWYIWLGRQVISLIEPGNLLIYMLTANQLATLH